MPLSIPYDPSLVLGNIVTKNKLDALVNIATLEAPANEAESAMNSLISLRRSMDMTIQDMINMGINPTEAQYTERKNLDKQISDAVTTYTQARINTEKKIQPLKAKIPMVSESLESPINYNRTQIKQMPLAADSLRMNCQYFSFDKNSQDAVSQANTISSFVSGELQYLGKGVEAESRSSAQSQVNSQYSKHDIAGTLVISINCTHKEATLLAPFILDVDKGIRVWNRMFPGDMIKPDSLSSIMSIARQADTKEEKSMSILSGATFGYSFVGMVHILKSSKTQSSQEMSSLASSIQGQLEANLWFENASGGLGMDSSTSNSMDMQQKMVQKVKLHF
ncbi:MAG: hypothetical protein GKR88_01805 [Flavobacteriaceae bacterium]|nr:MAG: hypothetical protein GKR88_01805 [Flavobacteriaceae bacterium]